MFSFLSELLEHFERKERRDWYHDNQGLGPGGRWSAPEALASGAPSSFPSDFLDTDELLTGRGNFQMEEAPGMREGGVGGDRAGEGVF